MKKKITVLLLPVVLLSSCIKKEDSSRENIEAFKAILESLEALNFTATINGDKYQYLGDDIINTKFNGISYEGGYIRKENVGIFDYVLINGVVETQGMISLNTEISPLDLLANPEYLFRIDIDKWIGNPDKKDNVELDLNSLSNLEKNFIVWSFDLDNNISNLNSILSVKGDFSSSYTFTVTYNDKSTKREAEKSIVIDKIGETINNPITDYLTNGSFNKKTDWTSFQKNILNQYELGDILFFEDYTIGLSLDFSYLSSLGIVFAYDLNGSQNQVNNMKEELYILGYDIVETASGVTMAIKKSNNTQGGSAIGKKIEFKYLSPNELDSNERVTCPNGYTQVVYSNSIYYEPSTLSGVNEVFTSKGIPTLDDSEMISSVVMSDATDLLNAEYRLAIEEENHEEGIVEVIEDVLAGAYIVHIYPKAGSRLREDVNAYAKAYLSKLVAAGFDNRSRVINEFLNIHGDIEAEKDYDSINHGKKAKIDRVNDTVIYIEVSSYDYEYSGYLEIYVEIYTRYGLNKIAA